jgi:hypothetical protein
MRVIAQHTRTAAMSTLDSFSILYLVGGSLNNVLPCENGQAPGGIYHATLRCRASQAALL